MAFCEMPKNKKSKNCSGFTIIGIPIQFFKNTKERQSLIVQRCDAEAQLQETNSNANYLLPRGERKYLKVIHVQCCHRPALILRVE